MVYLFHGKVNNNKIACAYGKGINVIHLSSFLLLCCKPTCTTAQITAAVFGLVTVTVTDSSGTVQPNLPVYAFKGSTYTGFNGTTDANGQLTLNLPQGNYRFRADLHGAQYFSGAENTCTVPTCTTISVVTPVYGQVTITAESGAGKDQADLPVYVFNETTYTGLSGVTGADGKVTLWIPAGSYRFRADQFDLQFFSAESNHCTVPECTTATVSTLGMQQVVTEQTIDYTYDPLNRPAPTRDFRRGLTGAAYDDGSSYAYTYDAVGNRLTENAKDETNRYVYDAANRLASVNGQAYTYDADGNLLADGTKAYTYNFANRLTDVTAGTDAYQYVYNGLGDRLQSILNGTTTTYSLDLNSGLTQVLADGTNTYTYGFNRIAQVSETQTGYFLGDALGSVRQIVDPQAEILLAQSYSPYGELLSSVGDYETTYSYTGEMTDGTGLVNLRARYYDPGTGRFMSKDTWAGDYNNPITLGKWLYANGNPIVYTDPSGKSSTDPTDPRDQVRVLKTHIQNQYGFILTSTDNLERSPNIENWDLPALNLLEEVSNMVAWKFVNNINWREVMKHSISPRSISGTELFRNYFDGVEIRRGPSNQNKVPGTGYYGKVSSSGNLYTAYGPKNIWEPGSQKGRNIILHEFGHIIDNRSSYKYSIDLDACNKLDYIIEKIYTYEKSHGYADMGGWGTKSGLGVNRRTDSNPQEIWADLFGSWVIDSFPTNPNDFEANDGTAFKN